MAAYYNENDPFAANWLRDLLAWGLIAPGDVDERSVSDVDAADLAPYTQCHFFAGIGGWSIALRKANWPDDRVVWTGSCPCQPFSSIGKKLGFEDDRHLWPIWQKLISERHPPVVFGEQSAKATDWLRLVRSDLEALDYAVGAVPIEAASAGADTLGDRFWFVATTDLAQLRQEPSARQQQEHEQNPRACPSDAWRSNEWRRGADGKKRRVNAGIDWMAHGVSNRMGKLRGFGNAIDPRLGAKFIQACAEVV